MHTNKNHTFTQQLISYLSPCNPIVISYIRDQGLFYVEVGSTYATSTGSIRATKL